MSEHLAGNLLKMQGELVDPVCYHLPIGEKLLHLNPLIGKKISFKFNGKINDIYDGKLIKKSYGQGFSYKNFITLARCDSCIVMPHLCHYYEGTCREPDWGEKNCLRPHLVYLANTSGLKVGITGKHKIPTRWIDQGASAALPILEVSDRKNAGLIEVEISKHLSDKTNWKQMLKREALEVDLAEERENVFLRLDHLLDDFEALDLEEQVLTINYPLDISPPKIKSLSFNKNPIIEGMLMGIKGQYLVLDVGVLNIRKHQGYFVELDIET